MGSRHVVVERFSVAEYTGIQRALHKQILTKRKQMQIKLQQQQHRQRQLLQKGEAQPEGPIEADELRAGGDEGFPSGDFEVCRSTSSISLDEVGDESPHKDAITKARSEDEDEHVGRSLTADGDGRFLVVTSYSSEQQAVEDDNSVIATNGDDDVGSCKVVEVACDGSEVGNRSLEEEAACDNLRVHDHPPDLQHLLTSEDILTRDQTGTASPTCGSDDDNVVTDVPLDSDSSIMDGSFSVEFSTGFPNCNGPLPFDPPDFGDSQPSARPEENEDDEDLYYFLQPLPTKQRRFLLKQSGLKKIDGSEKEECRKIRSSREVCGCECKVSKVVMVVVMMLW